MLQINTNVENRVITAYSASKKYRFNP